MKLGILGTGMIVKDVLTMYHELGVEKTYLFSTKKSKSQALELMKKYHLDKVYTDYDELLQSDVDAIYCALPNHLHYEFSKKALASSTEKKTSFSFSIFSFSTGISIISLEQETKNKHETHTTI